MCGTAAFFSSGTRVEIERNKMEEESLNQLEVLTTRIDFTSLATRN
jgi:hypothetical protein